MIEVKINENSFRSSPFLAAASSFSMVVATNLTRVADSLVLNVLQRQHLPIFEAC